MVAIQMSQEWLNSEQISLKSSKKYNLEDSFYSNRSRVGITGFIFDCFAGKQEEEDLESAPRSELQLQSATESTQESLTSALFASTQMISSAVTSLTTGFASLFTWKSSEQGERKITEMKTFNRDTHELFEVVIEGEKLITDSAVTVDSNSINQALINDIPVIQAVDISHNTQIRTNELESPKMNEISYNQNIDKKLQDEGDFLDPNDFWYKEEDFEDNEEEDLFETLSSSRSFYAMPSYIDFSQDSSIKIQPIPKRKDSKKLKVHFEPMVELMDYVVNNDKAAIKKVLQSGQVKVNDYDKLGYTMLHYAASHNHSDLLKYLIEKEGANVNCVDSTDWTPLHLAAIADNFKACKVLLDHGANFEYPNCDDHLPIDLTEDVKVKKMFAEAAKKKLSSKKVRAIYDWEAESPEFLTMKKSEGLKVLERRQEVWLVQNESKRIGLVPRIFVQ